MNYISKTFFTALKLLELKISVGHAQDMVYLEATCISCGHLRVKKEIRSFRLTVSRIVSRIILYFRRYARLFLDMVLKKWAYVLE